jgi:hypothetical protein
MMLLQLLLVLVLVRSVQDLQQQPLMAANHASFCMGRDSRRCSTILLQALWCGGPARPQIKTYAQECGLHYSVCVQSASLQTAQPPAVEHMVTRG